MNMLLTLFFVFSFLLSPVSAESRHKLQIIESRFFSGIVEKESQFLVISDQNRFLKYYKKIRSLELPMPSSPDIDFDQHLVLIVLMGQRPTAGYAITFDEVVLQHGSALAVIVKTTKPPPGAILAQVMTNPYVMATINKGTYDKVKFRDEQGILLKIVDLE